MQTCSWVIYLNYNVQENWKVIDYEWNEIDTVNDQVDIVELESFNKQTNRIENKRF